MPNDLKFSDWVRKLSESGFMKGLYTWKTDLKLDSLGFLTLNTKLRAIRCSAFSTLHEK